MVYVRLEDLTKRFGNLVAVDNVNLKVDEGQFFTMLGPSGCGKTTTLRIIAGFYKPDSGAVYFGEEKVTQLPPWKRNTGMVFQNYALWPHMTLFENIAYGLRVRKVPEDELRRRVRAVLEMVGLAGYEKTTPGKISGGQQQRVALARALVIEPQVLLLDEPLSNLDAKLRVQMRTEIKKLQKQLKTTTIYVTHDQEEALSLSDKIAIMHSGKVEQIGTNREIYENPVNRFVAEFIGEANFLSGKVMDIGQDPPLLHVQTDHGLLVQANTADGITVGEQVLVTVRPEALRIVKGRRTSDGNTIEGTVRIMLYHGELLRYEVETSWGQTMKVDVPNPRQAGIISEGSKVLLGFASEDTHTIPLGSRARADETMIY